MPSLIALFANAITHINELYDWFCANRLSLNANKTKYMVIRPKHSWHDISHYSVYTCIGNTTLTRIGNDCTEKSTKLIGMHLDENLSWKYHINEINKISKSLFFLKQVKKMLPLDSLKTLYYGLIFPHLSYGSIAWGSADKGLIRQTELL